MPTFHYKLVDNTGKNAEGTIEAKDKFAVYHVVKKEGDTIISVKEIGDNNFSLEKYLPFWGSVKTHDKIVFARNLSQMIDAGLPITRGLSIMERQAKPGKFKNVIKDLNESISKGSTLSDAMKNHEGVFSTLFIAMTKAGEESGNLSLALKNIAVQMEKSYQLTKKIRGALMYPTIIIVLIAIIGVLMMIYMVPTLTATFTGLGVKLPLSTRIIIGISSFLQSYFIIAILGLIFISFGLFAFFKTKRGQKYIDTVILHTPIIGDITKEINSARTARTLSSLLSSGVNIVTAINVTKDVVQNSYYKNILGDVQTAIEKGNPISTVFLANERFYPLFVGEMVSVGEETGKIGGMLSEVADFYEEEVDQKTKDMSSVIEPFLMVFIGIVVGIFAISVISPIYSLGDSIK